MATSADLHHLSPDAQTKSATSWICSVSFTFHAPTDGWQSFISPNFTSLTSLSEAGLLKFLSCFSLWALSSISLSHRGWAWCTWVTESWQGQGCRNSRSSWIHWEGKGTPPSWENSGKELGGWQYNQQGKSKQNGENGASQVPGKENYLALRQPFHSPAWCGMGFSMNFQPFQEQLWDILRKFHDTKGYWKNYSALPHTSRLHSKMPNWTVDKGRKLTTKFNVFFDQHGCINIMKICMKTLATSFQVMIPPSKFRRSVMLSIWQVCSLLVN